MNVMDMVTGHLRSKALAWATGAAVAVAGPLLPYLREMVDAEMAYQLRDLVDGLCEVGWLRAPMGLLLVVVATAMSAVLNANVLEDEREDGLMAMIEMVLLASGAMLGGAAFVVGALAMKAMRRCRYGKVVQLLLLLLILEWLPGLLAMLPKRPPMGVLDSLWALFL